MLRLQQAVDDYVKNSTISSPVQSQDNKKPSLKSRKKIENEKDYHDKLNVSTRKLTKKELEAAAIADQALDNYFVRFARQKPLKYIKIIGHLMVMVELVAMLTPAIAMGIQWVTALCDDAPVLSILELIRLGFVHITGMNSDELVTSHCIIRNNN